MPLDDNEQKILAEIERQFYEEDPELARAVRNIHKPARVGVKLSVVGMIAGLTVIIAFFATNTIIALAGFALLVGCTTTLITGLKARWWSDDRVEESEDAAE